METRNQAHHQLVDAYGEFFRKYDPMWRHFVTPTFSEPYGRDACWGVLHRWIERIEEDVGGKVWWVAAYEKGSGGMPHFHALVGAEADLLAATIEGAWIHGFCHVSEYDSKRKAAFYLAKHFTSEEADYLFELPSKRAMQRIS